MLLSGFVSNGKILPIYIWTKWSPSLSLSSFSSISHLTNSWPALLLFSSALKKEERRELSHGLRVRTSLQNTWSVRKSEAGWLVRNGGIYPQSQNQLQCGSQRETGTVCTNRSEPPWIMLVYIQVASSCLGIHKQLARFAFSWRPPGRLTLHSSLTGR